jgi:hypothetical protein
LYQVFICYDKIKHPILVWVISAKKTQKHVQNHPKENLIVMEHQLVFWDM